MGEPGFQKALLFAGERQATGESDKQKAQLFADERQTTDGLAGISLQG